MNGDTNTLKWKREGFCIRCTSHKPNTYGYPRLQRAEFKWPIARWILYKRLGNALTRDVVSRHTCDNRWCINPHHILSGSHADNMKDRNARGRQAYGLRQGLSKLTPELVREIRLLGEKMTHRQLAKKFGRGKSTIQHVLWGRTWRHVV